MNERTESGYIENEKRGGHIVSALRGDPAEQNGYLRFFYRNWRPTRLGKIWNRTFAWISGFGLTSQSLVTLQLKSQHSHRLYSIVLAAVDYQGQRYLVSMLGNSSNWVQDVRAAQGRALTWRGRSQPVILANVPPQERAPILNAWCQVGTSGRRHMPISHEAPVAAFEAIAADYPVFRIDSVTQSSSDGPSAP